MKSQYHFFFLFFAGCLLANNLSAQFGLSASYRSTQDQFLATPSDQSNALENGYEIGLDYWFRLPQKRIEFLPTLTYGNYKDVVLTYGNRGIAGSSAIGMDINEFGFQFRTNVYLFDLGTDCDCPTWGKQGPAFHKGFFLQLAPGVSHFRSSVTVNEEGFPLEESSGQTLFNLGIGAGIDFGISNLVTLTPQITYRHYFADFGPAGSTPFKAENAKDNANISNLLFGLRVGVRLDKRRY